MQLWFKVRAIKNMGLFEHHDYFNYEILLCKCMQIDNCSPRQASGPDWAVGEGPLPSEEPVGWADY